MQGQDSASTGDKRTPLDGDRDQDHHYRGESLPEGLLRQGAPVDDTAFSAGLCCFLPHVHRGCPEIFRKDPFNDGRENKRAEDLQSERLPYHRIHDLTRNIAEAYTRNSGAVLRMVLLRPRPRTPFRRNPLPAEMATSRIIHYLCNIITDNNRQE